MSETGRNCQEMACELKRGIEERNYKHLRHLTERVANEAQGQPVIGEVGSRRKQESERSRKSIQLQFNIDSVSTF